MDPAAKIELLCEGFVRRKTGETGRRNDGHEMPVGRDDSWPRHIGGPSMRRPPTARPPPAHRPPTARPPARPVSR
jgi:hypothetical protein